MTIGPVRLRPARLRGGLVIFVVIIADVVDVVVDVAGLLSSLWVELRLVSGIGEGVDWKRMVSAATM